MLPEIRPCPFCGNKSPIVGGDSRTERMRSHRVWCILCATQGPIAGDESDAIAQWNAAPRVPGLWNVVELDRATGLRNGKALMGDRFVKNEGLGLIDALPVDVAVSRLRNLSARGFLCTLEVAP